MRAISGRQRCRSRREHGATAVELAIVLPILLLCVCGFIDLSLAFWAKQRMLSAAQETALSSARDPDVNLGEADVQATAKTAEKNAMTSAVDNIPSFNITQIKLEGPMDLPGDAVADLMMVATIEGTYTAIFPFIFKKMDLRARAVARCEFTSTKIK